MTMDKDEIIRVAEMNIDDLRKSKMKKISIQKVTTK